MRHTRFLFAAVVVGTITFGFCRAAEPPREPGEQKSGEKQTTSNHAAEPAPANHGRGKPDQTNEKPSDSKELGERFKPKEHSREPEKGSRPGPAKSQAKRPLGKEPHRPEPKKAPAAADEGLAKHKDENHVEELAKLAARRALTAPTPGIRARGATATGVGKVLGVSAMTSVAKNSAGPLNGLALQRKP